MKKEVFLAVFVGFVLGLIITFGIWTANKTLHSQTPAITPTPLAQITPVPTSVPSSSVLTVTSPDNESVSAKDSVSLSGKTLPNSPIVVTYESGQSIITSDTTGIFTADIPLEGGYNRITVSAFDSAGIATTKQILITYTTSKI